jgi:uncharacterized damage-inducible protein DinB
MNDFERRKPPLVAPEKELLMAWLDYHRATLLRKIDGLTDEQLRRQMTPSGLSLLGLVKHLGYVERGWFRIIYAGEQLSRPSYEHNRPAEFRIEPDETTQQIIDFYKGEVAAARKIVAGGDLDAVAQHHPTLKPTLRWIVTHMIEETARHNGHADIMRELIDGTTGE